MVREVLAHKMPTRWISACGHYHVSIHAKCVREILALSVRHYPKEIGASVYGSYSDDGFKATVLGNAPIPSDSDSQRYSFHRGVNGVAQFFSKLFRQSLGGKHYVGEWHSHPGGPAEPSGIDDRSLLAIAANRETNCPECILILIGGNITQSPELGVFVYSRVRGRIDLRPE